MKELFQIFRHVFADFLRRWPEWLIGIGLALVFILLAAGCTTPHNWGLG